MTTKSVLCLLALFSCLMQAIAADSVTVDGVRSLPTKAHPMAGDETGKGPDVTVMDNGDGTVTMSNGIAAIVIVTKTARLNSVTLNSTTRRFTPAGRFVWK